MWANLSPEIMFFKQEIFTERALVSFLQSNIQIYSCKFSNGTFYLFAGKRSNSIWDHLIAAQALIKVKCIHPWNFFKTGLFQED